jgi:hypothetical protein
VCLLFVAFGLEVADNLLGVVDGDLAADDLGHRIGQLGAGVIELRLYVATEFTAGVAGVQGVSSVELADDEDDVQAGLRDQRSSSFM